MTPTSERSPRLMQLLNISWIAISMLFLATSIGYIWKIHAAHQPISPWQYFMAVVWFALLIFWLRQAWSRWGSKVESTLGMRGSGSSSR